MSRMAAGRERKGEPEAWTSIFFSISGPAGAIGQTKKPVTTQIATSVTWVRCRQGEDPISSFVTGSADAGGRSGGLTASWRAHIGPKEISQRASVAAVVAGRAELYSSFIRDRMGG